MRKEVRTEIEVNSTALQVWRVLTDFEAYGQWNPFIRRASGHASEGSRIEIHIETPGGSKRTYRPTITKAQEGKELRWVGKSSIPGFLSGEHIFSIEEAGSGTVRFVQREVFDGILTSFFGRSLDDDIKRGLQEMNRALKARAESLPTR